MIRSWMIVMVIASVVMVGPRRSFGEDPAAAKATASQADAKAPVAPPPSEQAVKVLIAASMGPDPALRSNAIEAMQMLPHRALPLTAKSLSDPHPGVRFAAVVTAGMLKFQSLAPAIEPLLTDENSSVRAAAIYALYSLGRPIDLTPLADMMQSRDGGLRGNVALLLGLLGDRSAVDLLKASAKAPMPRASAAQTAVVRAQIAEAISRLGDDTALDVLRAGAYSTFGEVRVLSITAMGAINDRGMEVAIERMLEEQAPELQLAAAGALARMGNGRGLTVTLGHTASTEPVVRAQAAWTLGWFTDIAAADAAKALLNDPVEQVRVAAAAAVLRQSRSTSGSGAMRAAEAGPG